MNIEQPLYYLNNPKLKAENVSINLTQDEIDEIKKCRNDPIYFIEKYVKIIDVAGNIIVPKLHDYQKKAIKHYLDNKLSCVMQPRQSAKTTTVSMLFVWYLIFVPNRVSYILANKAATARKILAQVKFSYENLPFFLQQGVVTWNKIYVELENNSKLFTAGTSSDGIRGETVTGILFWDEVAWVKNSIAEEFFTSVYPTVSQPNSKAKFIAASTPRGFNFFYKIWNDAVCNRTDFKANRVFWRDIPGRDNSWAEREKQILGELKFRQEVECEFLGSSYGLISTDTIVRLSADIPIHSSPNISIYAEPEAGHNYLIICDPSRGLGNDYSAFMVFDITQFPIKPVAKFYDNEIAPTDLPLVLYNVAKSYNNADVLIEINDNGEHVATILFEDLEYENTIIFDRPGGKTAYGIRTTKSVKARGCAAFKELLENNQLIVNDSDVIMEITNFIQKGNSFVAETGYHDDLVMCHVLLGWYTQTNLFKQSTDLNYREQLLRQREKQIEESVLPFGFIYDGRTDDDLPPGWQNININRTF